MPSSTTDLFLPACNRGLDILFALLGLCLLAPLIIGIALLLLRRQGRPLLHRDLRIGRGGKPFMLLKFRTLRVHDAGSRTAAADDPRITAPGHRLRRWRLDELPQLINVLRGDMSLVGPRPMPPEHVASLLPLHRVRVLSIRPGITDPAALYFLAEDDVLAGHADAERLYLQRLLPVKTAMQVDYLGRRNFFTDLKTVVMTPFKLWSPWAHKTSARRLRALLERDSPRPHP